MKHADFIAALPEKGRVVGILEWDLPQGFSRLGLGKTRAEARGAIDAALAALKAPAFDVIYDTDDARITNPLKTMPMAIVSATPAAWRQLAETLPDNLRITPNSMEPGPAPVAPRRHAPRPV